MQVDIIIEIPSGGGNKYQLDHQTGRMRLDRTIFTSMVFAPDYGAIEGTLSEDGIRRARWFSCLGQPSPASSSARAGSAC